MAKGIQLGELGRRDVLRAGLIGLGGGIAGFGAGPVNEAAAATPMSVGSRILVVVELSGANDGLNTIIPYTNDAYYRARPKLGLKLEKIRRLDDQFGVRSGMAGFERLFKDGQLAVVHGVGYKNPSFSHFTSMAYWQTGAPNSGDPYGWLGRLADSLDPSGSDSYIVDVEARQSLAVKARAHVPLTFFQPDRFKRDATFDEKSARDQLAGPRTARNGSEAFLFDVAASAERAEVHVRDACAAYRTPVDYGLVHFGLERVAALIAANFPTRIYYVSYPHNAFDTHVNQADNHAHLLTYTSDHIAAFLADIARIGRGSDVSVMVFSEFGRHVGENANLGTDHGTAGPSFILGQSVRGGQYGAMPDLTNLDDGNMRFTTDFRRVYATMASSWMGGEDIGPVLKGDFGALPVFQA
jgi:uncharacterized protein (DUF1501 family)